jgi:hypothetical protein
MCKGSTLVSWELIYTKHAQQEAQKLSSAGLKEKTQALFSVAAWPSFSIYASTLRN